jgi:flavin-dependent dehydrogenase
MQTSTLINQDDLSRVRLNIIIVGAGLGGLAAAIALARKGHHITVIEQAPALAEVCPSLFEEHVHQTYA